MQKHPTIDVYKDRGQCVIVLLVVLAETRTIFTKQETLACIQQRGYLELRQEDWKPFDTQTEPGWHTRIAWARKDSVLRSFMFSHDERDAWELTRQGHDLVSKLRQKSADGRLDVRRCYLWTPKFKKVMCPTYEPSGKDSQHPSDWTE